MPEYTLVIRIPAAGNKEFSYSVNLTGTDVNYPEDYFYSRTQRGKDNRAHLHLAIQQESERTVSDEQLNRIIAEWTKGIKSGKSRRTVVVLDLPPEVIAASKANSNQSRYTPSLDFRPEPILPIKTTSNPPPKPVKNSDPVLETSENRLSSIPNPPIPGAIPGNHEPVPVKTKENTPASSETWSIDNQADF